MSSDQRSAFGSPPGIDGSAAAPGRWRRLRLAAFILGGGCILGSVALLLADRGSTLASIAQGVLTLVGIVALATGVGEIDARRGYSPPRLPARREWRVRPAFLLPGVGCLIAAGVLAYLAAGGWMMTLAVAGIGLTLYGLWPALVAAARAERWFCARRPGWDGLLTTAIVFILLGALGTAEPDLAVKLMLFLGLVLAAFVLFFAVLQGIRLYTGRVALTSEPPAVPPDHRVAGPRDAAPDNG